MLNRYRGDRQSLTFSSDVGGGVTIALKDVGSHTIGKLELVAGGTAPLIPGWPKHTAGAGISTPRVDVIAGPSTREKAPLTVWPLPLAVVVGDPAPDDIWMSPDHRFRLHSSYLRGAALRTESGDRVASIDVGGSRAGSIRTWPTATSVPALCCCCF